MSGWPDLSVPGWQDSSTALHLFTQVVGKTRLALAAPVNHWWHVALYVTARGLTTSPMPAGERVVEVEFDLLAHRLEIRASDGASDGFALGEHATVAAFHTRYLQGLRRLGVEVSIQPVAVEIPQTIYLDRDTARRYDPEWTSRFLDALVLADEVLKQFRGSFIGKASPVHFFWGGFNLAVTRFSGRRAPRHPGGIPHVRNEVMVEAYSHEVSSAGFWPGGAACPRPLFYSYAYPQPEGFTAARVLPDGAAWDTTFGEFTIPYDAIRAAPSPERALTSFLETTYEAAADLARWNRIELERPAPHQEHVHGLPV